MMRHVLVSNLFASTVHELVLFLARIAEREFVAPNGIQKRTIPESASTRCTETIETAKYSVLTVGIHYKAVYDVPSINEYVFRALSGKGLLIFICLLFWLVIRCSHHFKQLDNV